GAMVRLSLFIIGIISLIPVSIVGLIGLVAWVIFPPLGLVYYLFQDPNSEKLLQKLAHRISHSSSDPLVPLFDSLPGRFLLIHLNTDPVQLAAQKPASLSFTTPPKNFASIIQQFIDSGLWDEQVFKQKGFNFSHLLLAAHWWDRRQGLAPDDVTSRNFNRPGIGLELLFGYTPTLDKYGTDLTLPQTFAHHLIGRSDIVNRIERSLTIHRSAVLVGLAGVGKKTVVYEFAHRCRTGSLGTHMSYKRVVELDYNFLLSKSIDINQKKALISQILEECVAAGNIVLVINDLHRLTRSDVEGLDFTDIFERFFEKKLLIIAISSASEYERFIRGNSRLLKHLDTIEVVAPQKTQAMEILLEFATMTETSKKIILTAQALESIISGSDKYITDT
ncbi:MAG: hypothetical protein L0Y74_05615, partial [candidate division Zixibacteria bacterium]|nr:hypothetical protein [candidate division Zixibacteria bacterium]